MKALAVCPHVNKLYLFILFSLLLFSCGDSAISENNKLREEISALSKEIQFIRAENARLRELNGEELQIGFEVQIAAFKEFNLHAYTDELVRFHEKKGFNYNKYVLGQFSHYEDAEAFLKDVHEMGIKDAFIAGIVDGKRSSIPAARVAAREYYGFEDLNEFASDDNSGWD